MRDEESGLSIRFIREFDMNKELRLIGGGTSEDFPERLKGAAESCKVILDRTITPKDAEPRREIYVERCGLRYGPYKSAAHARQHGFVLPETTEAE